MDEADIASEQEEYARAEAIWRVRRPSKLQPRGRCFNCDDPAPGLFCDVECRRDYEREQRVRQQQQAQQ
jgi:hypothetical protein